MKLAADTPNYIPKLGFFVKMALADHFALADDQLFRQQSPTCRTAIKSASGKQWLTVPVLHRPQQLICEVQIDNQRRWRQKHFKTLTVNYAYAPYFPYFIDFFDSLYQKQWRFLLDLNLTIIEYIRDILRIESGIVQTNSLSLNGDVSQRTIDLCRARACNSYLASPEIARLLKKDAFTGASIEIDSITWKEPLYRQQFGDWIPGLSVIDMLFNEGPEAIWILAKILSKSSYNSVS